MKRTMLLMAVLTALAGLPACKDSDTKQSDTKQSGSQGRGQGPVRAACDAEIKKLCTGDERAGRCLRKHPDDLSDGCKAALATRGQQH